MAFGQTPKSEKWIILITVLAVIGALYLIAKG